MKQKSRLPKMTSRAQLGLHIIGSVQHWYEDMVTGPWLVAMQDCAKWHHGDVLLKFDQCMNHDNCNVEFGQARSKHNVVGTLYPATRVGCWRFRPFKRHKKAKDPIGVAPNSNDRCLDWFGIVSTSCVRHHETSFQISGCLINVMFFKITIPHVTHWVLSLVFVLSQSSISCLPRLERIRQLEDMDAIDYKACQLYLNN